MLTCVSVSVFVCLVGVFILTSREWINPCKVDGKRRGDWRRERIERFKWADLCFCFVFNSIHLVTVDILDKLTVMFDIKECFKRLYFFVHLSYLSFLLRWDGAQWPFLHPGSHLAHLKLFLLGFAKSTIFHFLWGSGSNAPRVSVCISITEVQFVAFKPICAA